MIVSKEVDKMKIEDLKVGQYVRFKDKRNITYIRNIREIPQDNRYASIYLDKEANYSKGLSLKNIIKASFDVIDILEVGDYVNGYPIYEIVEYEDNTRAIVIGDDNKSIIWKKQDIEDVITKEQFKQMKYRIGE